MRIYRGDPRCQEPPMTIRTVRHFCSTRMGQVHCVDAVPTAGDAALPPFVLLHQTPRSVDEFAEVQPLLAAHRRTLAIDTPGYGCSDRVAGQPSVEDYAGAVLDVLDALGVDRCVLVGHHTGEIVAVEIAAAAPERVAAVVLSGPVDLDAAGRAYLLPFFRQWHVAADGSHLLDKWQKFAAWVPRPDLVQRILLDLFRAGESSEQGHFATTEYRMEERLPRVRCPALLLYGSRDPFGVPARATLHRQAFSPVREATIDAGVFAPNENPDAYAAAVLEFATSL
jgi:pimeloyl-ACP methyl ester carboxylesterase